MGTKDGDKTKEEGITGDDEKEKKLAPALCQQRRDMTTRLSRKRMEGSRSDRL